MLLAIENKLRQQISEQIKIKVEQFAEEKEKENKNIILQIIKIQQQFESENKLDFEEPQKPVLQNVEINQEILDKIKQIRKEFEDPQEELCNLIKNYPNICEGEITKSPLFTRSLGLSSEGEITVKIQYDETFAVTPLWASNESMRKNYILQSENSREYYDFDYLKSLALSKDHYFLGHSYYKLNGQEKDKFDFISIKQQYKNNDFQRKQLNLLEQDENYSNTTHKWGSTCADGVIRPEQILMKLEEQYRHTIFGLNRIAQNTIGLDLYCLYRTQFCETIIFNDLKNTLIKMLQIVNVSSITNKINNNEFDINVLRQRPHIQTLQRIMSMQKMMQEFENNEFFVDQQKANENKKQQLDQEERQKIYQQKTIQFNENLIQSIQKMQKLYNITQSLQIFENQKKNLEEISKYATLAEQQMKLELEQLKQSMQNELLQKEEPQLQHKLKDYQIFEVIQFEISQSINEQLNKNKNEITQSVNNKIDSVKQEISSVKQELYEIRQENKLMQQALTQVFKSQIKKSQ